MMRIKTFEKFELINEEISPIRMDKEEIEECHKNKLKKYKIYTSQDGVIEFDDTDLVPYDEEETLFFLNFDFKQNYKSFNSSLEVKVYLDEMFIFIETDHGDFAEYKIFTD